MPDIASFSKVAPYLVNPLVLIGFGLFLVFGIHWALIRAGLLTPLSQRQSAGIVRWILKYGFWLAILLLVLGFAYAFRTYDSATRKGAQGSITQQSGPCSSNTAGDNNNVNVDCTEKEKATKQK